MTALLVAFAFGTIWWYSFTILWLILMLVFLDKERIFTSTFLLILYFVFLQWIAKVDVLKDAFSNPLNTLIVIIAYIVIGIFWSFIKWWLYVSEKADILKREKIAFLEDIAKGYEESGSPYPPGFNLQFPEKCILPANFTENWERKKRFHPSLKASTNKNRIALWITYWPLSMLWSLIHDFIHRMIKRLVITLQKIYDGITTRAMKGIN